MRFISWGGDTGFDFKWIDGPIELTENFTMRGTCCKGECQLKSIGLTDDYNNQTNNIS